MKWSEIISRRNVLFNIPMELGDKSLSGDASADVILTRVAYEKKAEEISSFMQDVMSGLKKDGYDEMERKVSFMRDVEAKMSCELSEKPSDDDVNEADRIRKEILPDYEKKREEIEKSFMSAQEKKMQEETDEPSSFITRKDFSEICGLMGVSGDFDFIIPNAGNQVKMSKTSFLSLLATMVI